ncbi:hypothetical protein [Bacillus bombysepticus]|uniref:hypothetical protein n=1 Tax=Bacillus bombysepticus TaxID=658666 RepID=UPI003015FC71
MNHNSNKSDEELERLYHEGDSRTSQDAENSLYNRGYTLDPETDTWDVTSNEKHTYLAGVPIPAGDWFILFALATLIVAVIATFIGGFIVIAYAVEYAVYIYIGFVITFVLMYLTRGDSKFVNLLFYFSCLALATRLFTNVIEVLEGVDYVTFITRDSDGLGVIIKYGFLYAIYAAIVPLLAMKIIVKTIRIKRSNFGNENSTLGN